MKNHDLSMSSLKITDKINNKYNTSKELRKLMRLLIGLELDEGFELFLPFYTDCGRNIHIEKKVIINSGCKFQYQGGVYIDENSLLGIMLF